MRGDATSSGPWQTPCSTLRTSLSGEIIARRLKSGPESADYSICQRLIERRVLMIGGADGRGSPSGAELTGVVPMPRVKSSAVPGAISNG
jgi:hypothetical protein